MERLLLFIKNIFGTDIFKKCKNDQPTIPALYNYRCSCGKLLKDHKVKTSSTEIHWMTLKMYYDLETCDIGNRQVRSKANGPHKFLTYHFIN